MIVKSEQYFPPYVSRSSHSTSYAKVRAQLTQRWLMSLLWIAIKRKNVCLTSFTLEIPLVKCTWQLVTHCQMCFSLQKCCVSEPLLRSQHKNIEMLKALPITVWQLSNYCFIRNLGLFTCHCRTKISEATNFLQFIFSP